MSTKAQTRYARIAGGPPSMESTPTRRLQPAPPIGEWIPLVSSNIHSVRYHADRRDMDVRFLNGAVYTYFDVDLEIFRGLVENRRPASYLAIYVKQRLRCRPSAQERRQSDL